MGTFAAGRRLPGVASRPWVIGAVLLCATGTLGVVANAAGRGNGHGRAAGIAEVFRINQALPTTGVIVVAGVATTAGLVALWWSLRKSRPRLLLAAVGGAILVVALHWRYDSRPELEGPPGFDTGLDLRPMLAGIGAALVFPQWRIWAAAGGCAVGGSSPIVVALTGTGPVGVLFPAALVVAGTAAAALTALGAHDRR